MPIEFPPSSFELLEMTPSVQWTLGGKLESLKVATPGDARVNEDRLEWIPGRNVDGEAEWWPDGDYAPKAVSSFFKLANETRPERIVDFVRRFGVLGIALDGLPSCGAAHRLTGAPHLQESWQGWAVSWEPLAAYPYYAAGAKAMLLLGTALKHSKPDQPVDPWRVFANADLVDAETTDLGSWGRTTAICRVWQRTLGLTWEKWWEKYQGAQTNLIAFDPAHIAFNFTLNRSLYSRHISDAEWAHAQRANYAYWLTDYWLGRSGLVPTVVWNDAIPRLGISVGEIRSSMDVMQPPNSLFRLVATHLAAVACGSTNTAQCSHCDALYSSPRKVRNDQPHYCESCRATAASRRTQRSRTKKGKKQDPN